MLGPASPGRSKYCRGDSAQIIPDRFVAGAEAGVRAGVRGGRFSPGHESCALQPARAGTDTETQVVEVFSATQPTEPTSAALLPPVAVLKPSFLDSSSRRQTQERLSEEVLLDPRPSAASAHAVNELGQHPDPFQPR